jgi:hypothetical protein
MGRPWNRKGPGNRARSNLWRAMAKGRSVDHSAKRVRDDSSALSLGQRAVRRAEDLQRLVESPLLEPLMVQRHRAQEVTGGEHRRQDRPQVARQRHDQVAMAPVLEAKQGLRQRPAVGERGLGPEEGKRSFPAAVAQRPITSRRRSRALPGGARTREGLETLPGFPFKRHCTAGTARPERDQRQLALRAEGPPLPDEGTAASAAGWPQNREHMVDEHTELSAWGPEKLRPARGRSRNRRPNPVAATDPAPVPGHRPWRKPHPRVTLTLLWHHLGDEGSGRLPSGRR